MASRKPKVGAKGKPKEESEEETEPIEAESEPESASDEDIIGQLVSEGKKGKAKAPKAKPKPESEEESEDEEEDAEEGSEEDEEAVEEPKATGKKVVEKDITLYAYQIKHVNKLSDMLASPLPPVPGNEDETGDDVLMGVIDRSPPGTGKTVATLKVKQEFGMNIVIFVPTVEVGANWDKESRRYNIPFKGVYTYSSLVGTAPRGKKKGYYVPKSGLLSRNLAVIRKGLGRTKKQLEEGAPERFEPEEKLLKLIRGQKKINKDTGEEEVMGTLFVFDEAHKATGKTSMTSEAVMKIIDLIANYPASTARFMLLSGSLFEKYENLVALLRVMGLMRSYFMVNPRTGEPAALGELMDFARRFDNKKVNALIKKYGNGIYSSRGKKQKDFVLELYEQAIQPNISSAMPGQDITLKINYLRYLKRDEVVQVGGALNLMHKTIDYEGKATIDLRRMVIMDIQNGLAPAAVRFAKEMLEKNLNRKVIIFYQYNQARDILVKGLKKYSPLVLAGTTYTSLEEREASMKKFNAPNNKSRVMIVSILVGALGIQLDDKHGGFPRRSIILPVWSLKTMMQAADRAGRADTVWGGSDDPALRDPEAEDRPRAYFFYAANATGPNPAEDTMIKLMKKAIEKGKMLGVAMKTETGSIPIMPDSFTIEYETPPVGLEDEYPPINSELSRVLREEAEKKSQLLFTDILEGRGITLADEEEDFGEQEIEEGEEEKPKAKGKKAAAKSRSKSTKKEEDSSEEEAALIKKAAAKKKKAAASKSRSKSTKKEESEEEEEKPKPKSKAKAKATSRSKSTKKEEESSEEEEPKPKSKAKPKPKVSSETESDEDLKVRSRKPTAKATAQAPKGAVAAPEPTEVKTRTVKPAAPTRPKPPGQAPRTGAVTTSAEVPEPAVTKTSTSQALPSATEGESLKK